jgi:hypothetical protein
MTKIAIENLLREVDEHLAEIVAQASTSTVRKKLEALHRTCRRIVCHEKLRLTIPLVRDRYGKLNPTEPEIAEQSIRNKRTSGNPYQSVYRKWEVVAEAMAAASSPRIVANTGGVLGDHDIRMIENPTLRHQVVLLCAQNKSLYNQLNILKQSQADVAIRIEGVALAPGSVDLLLSDAEVEAVRDFVDPRKLKAKHLQRTQDNGVKLKDGRPIADPGFVSALEKIVRSYERQ